MTKLETINAEDLQNRTYSDECTIALMLPSEVLSTVLCDMPFPTLPLICRGSSGEMPILEACFLVI